MKEDLFCAIIIFLVTNYDTLCLNSLNVVQCSEGENIVLDFKNCNFDKTIVDSTHDLLA